MARSTVRATRQLLSIGQAAEYAGISTKTVRRRIADGSLPGYRAGKRLIRVDQADVDRLLRPIPVGGDAA